MAIEQGTMNFFYNKSVLVGLWYIPQFHFDVIFLAIGYVFDLASTLHESILIHQTLHYSLHMSIFDDDSYSKHQQFCFP